MNRRKACHSIGRSDYLPFEELSNENPMKVCMYRERKSYVSNNAPPGVKFSSWQMYSCSVSTKNIPCNGTYVLMYLRIKLFYALNISSQLRAF